MTFIAQQPDDTRAKRRFSAKMAGLFPTENRDPFTSTRRTKAIQATRRNRDYSSAHPCKLRLLFP